MCVHVHMYMYNTSIHLCLQVGYSIRFEDCTSERTCVKVSNYGEGVVRTYKSRPSVVHDRWNVTERVSRRT